MTLTHRVTLRYTDPTGHIAEEEDWQAQEYVRHLRDSYGISVAIDWGRGKHWQDDLLGRWSLGAWELQGLEWAVRAADEIAHSVPAGALKSIFAGRISLRASDENMSGYFYGRGDASFATVLLGREAFESFDLLAYTFTHEVGHALDYVFGYRPSQELRTVMGSRSISSYAQPGASDRSALEDFADSFAAYVNETRYIAGRSRSHQVFETSGHIAWMNTWIRRTLR